MLSGRQEEADRRLEDARALLALRRPAEALPHCEAAIALEPGFAEAHDKLGVALYDLGRFDEALASFDRALALRPNLADARLNRSMCLLLMGRFDAAWRDYENRKGKWDEDAHRHIQGRPWLGDADLTGRRLFIYHEQGLGDSIQCIRYVQLLAARGAHLVVSVQDSLKPLVEPLLPGVELLGEDQRPERFDYYCPLLSLPLAFKTTAETIPSQPLPLRADPERRARFERLLGPKTRLRIGVAWSGNPSHKNDLNRSIPFEIFARLLSDDIQWSALQTSIKSEDVPAFLDRRRVETFGPEIDDFRDTAALVDLMDLVISVDTSIAHLAGAMGKPVWILLPFVPDWRWMLGRRDSPWYPSARLFRQPKIGDWASVIEAVNCELAAWPKPSPPAGAWTASVRVTLPTMGGGFRRP
jgi:hypothetical protein